MAYTINRPYNTRQVPKVNWDTHCSERECPTLAEVINAAKKEFPEVPFEQLIITTSGYDADIILLKPREFY